MKGCLKRWGRPLGCLNLDNSSELPLLFFLFEMFRGDSFFNVFFLVHLECIHTPVFMCAVFDVIIRNSSMPLNHKG